MKKVLAFVILICISFSVFGQSPEKMSYQAIVRNADGSLVSEKQVGIKISILKNSTTGTIVYSETHLPTTNINGLVTFEIGSGAVINGDFSIIEWGLDSYFIKTETDLEGGSNYTISGISQFLSVPYALHAKNVFSGNYDDLINKPKVSEIKTYKVGDFAQGGIVFWVDDTEQHGLVVANVNQSLSTKWQNTFGETYATGNGFYAGKSNTSIIIPALIALGQSPENTAAKLCHDLQIIQDGVTYGDWYLPSRLELNLIYQSRTLINTTAGQNGGDVLISDVYWSSTENSDNSVWGLDFANGQEADIFKTFENGVRAIRSF
jgi:hypothetical protein